MAKRDTRGAVISLANEWAAKGMEVTPTAIRRTLGYGSFSTIVETLRSWSPPSSQPPPLPEIPQQHPQLLAEMRALRETLQSTINATLEMQAHAKSQLNDAYARYEAVQKRMLLEIEEARQRVRTAEAAAVNVADDYKRRETILRQQLDTLRDRASTLEGENNVLRGLEAERPS